MVDIFLRAQKNSENIEAHLPAHLPKLHTTRRLLLSRKRLSVIVY
jgi:hypothetical protein